MVTEQDAKRVLETVDAGLTQFKGHPVPGQMCAIAATCFGLGLAHGDDSPGVLEAAKSFTRALNDSSRWLSPLTRARGMRRLVIAQLDSDGAVDERVFTRRLVQVVRQRLVTVLLDAVVRWNTSDSNHVAAAVSKCRQSAEPLALLELRNAVIRVQVSTGDLTTWNMYETTTRLLNLDDEGEYLGNVGYRVALAANAACDLKTTSVDADRLLADVAEDAVSVLVDMSAPGCRWLDLAPRSQS